MRLALFQRDIDAVFRVVPFVTGLAAAVLSVLPLHVPGLAIATPAFALMTVYHWTIYRPEWLPPSAVFALGLLLDLLDGTPYLGISALMLLLARSFVLSERGLVATRGFTMVWGGFLIVAGLVNGLEWLLTSLLSGMPLGPRPFIYQAVVTVAVFPVVSYLLAQLQRGLWQRA